MTQTRAQQALVTLSGISKAFDGKTIIPDFDLTIGRRIYHPAWPLRLR